MIDGLWPAARVGHCTEHVVQALGGLRLRQGVCAQEDLHLPIGPGSGVDAHQNHVPAAPPRPAPFFVPGHSHVLQAVRCAHDPLLCYQEASAHVLAVHLHRCHVGPGVGWSLLTTQDPATGLCRWR